MTEYQRQHNCFSRPVQSLAHPLSRPPGPVLTRVFFPYSVESYVFPGDPSHLIPCTKYVYLVLHVFLTADNFFFFFKCMYFFPVDPCRLNLRLFAFFFRGEPLSAAALGRCGFSLLWKASGGGVGRLVLRREQGHLPLRPRSPEDVQEKA